jgi:hypothetical protein
MERKLSHHDTLGLQEVVELGGDLLLLPEQTPLPTEEAHTLYAQGVIPTDESLIMETLIHIARYEGEYVSARCNGREPGWINEVPIALRTYLRLNYALREEDPLAIVLDLPYTGLSYMVRDEGLCARAQWKFHLNRLQHVKQLGFLQTPIYNESVKVEPLSQSTRYLHSLDVMAIATVIGNNVRAGSPFAISEVEFRALRVAAFTHDACTPAGGDSVKLAAPEDLDEDRNYVRALSRMPWQDMKSTGITKKLLAATIQGEGLLGEILDIADKIAYVARDAHTCLHHIEAGAKNDLYGMMTLTRLIDRFPYACGIWDSVAVRSGRAVFTDVRRLLAFLKIRVLLFRELYYHPASRFGEFLISRLLVKVLYEQKRLTRDQLLEMTDSDLLQALDAEFGIDAVVRTCSSDLARCATFTGLAEAKTFMEGLRQAGNVFAMLDDNRRAIKPGTHFLVSTKDGPQPLAVADPGSARELDEMARVRPMVHVYYLDGDPALPREHLARLVKHLRRKTPAR